MVISSMKKTLGLTEEELQMKLESLVTDGVYLSGKHRVRGGGYLDLHSYLEDLLDLAPDVISDQYDGGHVIQLALSDTLKGKTNDEVEGPVPTQVSEFFESVNEIVFRTMGEFKEHKNLLIFEKVSREIKDTVLRNKGNQDTRWARAFLEGLHSFVRNVATFHEIYVQQVAEL